MAKVRTKAAIKSKRRNKGADGVVTRDAANSRYRRAIKRGVDVNGNAVPKGLKGDDRIKWAKSVENNKSKAKTGTERSKKSRASAKQREQEAIKNLSPEDNVKLRTLKNVQSEDMSSIRKINERLPKIKSEGKAKLLRAKKSSLESRVASRQKKIDALVSKGADVKKISGYDKAVKKRPGTVLAGSPEEAARSASSRNKVLSHHDKIKRIKKKQSKG